MKRDMHLANCVFIAFVAFATFALNGCGADDSSSMSAASTSNSTPTPVSNDFTPNTANHSAAPTFTASSTLAADSAAYPSAASDVITQNMQASLAADNQQVAPVMHYAPGDSGSSN
ncbi:hypothetical protein P3T18_005997 [Paraburkholderia sp. GAS199]|uniref:hypothetical protein n=1 Tax=Paraburkholderia sp. GAS199 TaxID=3035126 RepID=UPI003D20B3C2